MLADRYSSFAVTVLGVLLAAVVGGTLGETLDADRAVVVGLAVATPLLFQFGYGFDTLDRDAYLDASDRTDLAADAALLVAAALLAGLGTAAVLDRVGASESVAIGVAVAATAAAGSVAFFYRTWEFHAFAPAERDDATGSDDAA